MPYTRIVTGKKTTLSKSFTLLMLLIFVVGISLSGITLARVLNSKAQHEVASTANVVMDILSSARDYTNNELASQLQERIKANEFVPQVIPSYNAKSIFKILHQNHSSYAEYKYKEAMLNPTNPEDKANEFERKIIKHFTLKPDIPQIEDFTFLKSGEKFFYTASPIIIKDSSCLKCHSIPAEAPEEMIRLYGANNGFGWKLNEVLGTQIVYIPANIVMRKAIQALLWVLGSIALIFAITIFAANFWLKRYVVNPVREVVEVAEAVSIGNMDAEFKSASNNEVGILVEAFTRMKVSLVMALERLEEYRLGNRRKDDSNRR
ncbi:Tll0287-like domain-containing protein [Mastigocoleus testarum]|uniref:Histidine kinase n=1 Tax=Mastigocoleus testarum BC008 TaxID=371196 RepID=A0A0V7ZET7_9CYAN|nr:DUF3365 domain-containing protein [Mastigocoleus testarum]KST62928.1 histidine kinase [Mastigocoleus testarum BC008]KST63019.1 histidine kinase [Mastigocoleus testarum BC008]